MRGPLSASLALGARRYEKMRLWGRYWHNRLQLYMKRCGCLPAALRPSTGGLSGRNSALNASCVSQMSSTTSSAAEPAQVTVRLESVDESPPSSVRSSAGDAGTPGP